MEENREGKRNEKKEEKKYEKKNEKMICHPAVPVRKGCSRDQLLRWALWNTGFFRCDCSCKSGWSSKRRRW